MEGFVVIERILGRVGGGGGETGAGELLRQCRHGGLARGGGEGGEGGGGEVAGEAGAGGGAGGGVQGGVAEGGADVAEGGGGGGGVGGGGVLLVAGEEIAVAGGAACVDVVVGGADFGGVGGGNAVYEHFADAAAVLFCFGVAPLLLFVAGEDLVVEARGDVVFFAAAEVEFGVGVIDW